MINSQTRLCCIIGNPVAHSLSPQMHNAAFKARGVNYVFLAFQVSDVKKAIEGFKAINVAGIVVTIPHKLEVMKHVDEIDKTAKIIGAVNAIVNRNGKLSATNTDWLGAINALEEKIDLNKKKVALLGAGGAARALAFGLKKKKADVAVFNRTIKLAEKLRNEFCLSGAFDLKELDRVINMDIIINATSIGMEPEDDVSLVPKKLISPHHLVFDIVYTPHETKLIRFAKEKGAKVIYGYKMVLYGGVRIFELFTGRNAPIKIMEKSLCLDF